MDKLEKLYQEFWKDEYDKKGIHNPAKFEYVQPFMYRSKELGFIKWLVDNDKIDLMKLKKWIEDNKFYCAKWGKITNMLLMLLSIQDNPIEFLISILK